MKLLLKDVLFYGIVLIARAVAKAARRRLPKDPPKQGVDDVQSN